MRKQFLSLTTAALIGCTTMATVWSTPSYAVDPFVGTIRYFGFNFAPRNWAHCNGQLLAVSQNDALFSLVGTTYGGDGRTTFGLPDMRGRVPVHTGQGPGLSNYPMGQKSGAERVTLNANQISHSHDLKGHNVEGNQAAPTGNSLAVNSTDRPYSSSAPSVQMNAGSIGNTGGSQSHENRPPYLGVYCSIALYGVYPSRN